MIYMENSFKFLDKNGIMWIDDYGGGNYNKIKKIKNDLLEKYKDKYKIIYNSYSLGIIKN